MKKQIEDQGIETRGSATRSIDLWFVLLLAFLAYLFVIIPPLNQIYPLRIIFALPILLFLPGYVLIAAMFPRRVELSGIERFTLSIGLSIAIFVFDGFAISVTVWRFRPEPIILSLALITLILTLITFIVRWRIPKEERFYINFSVFSQFFDSLRTEEKTDEIVVRALIIALVGSIIIASGMLAYAKITFEEERFTAFYILGEGGKAENYTKEVYLLEPSSMIVGIENYEHAAANYTLQVYLGGYPTHKQQITLAHGDKWEDTVFFTPKHVAKHAKLEFMLYKDGSTDPYRSVHLWVDSLIDYENLAVIRRYALPDPPAIENPDMESETNWTFTENAGYFRGQYTKFYRMDENATLCGYVTDNTTGDEIANARVSVSNLYGYEKTDITNESGYYEMNTIADHFRIDSTADRYEKSETVFDIAGGQTLVVNMTNDPKMAFNMTLEELSIINETIETLLPGELPEEVSTVDGYVSDIVTGLPIANASINVRSEYGFERDTTTNNHGYFEVNTIPGSSHIEVKARGYALNSSTVKIAKVHTVNPKLTPENSTVTGYIYDNATGAPVSGATIKVSTARYTNTTRSDASGYYTVKSIAGHVLLDVSKGGYFSNGTEFNISYAVDMAIDVVIDPIPPKPPLPPPSMICGYVSYKGTELPGMTVRVSDHKGYEKSTLTDSKGYYEIETVPGHLWLDVLPSVYMASSVEFDIKSGQIATLNIELDAFSSSTYQIQYPSETALLKGRFGGIYQDIISDEGVAALAFKVCDTYSTNRSAGCLYKQVLLNELVLWEDDVEGDEDWQEVRIPITLDNGTNRLMLRVYAKQDSNVFPVTVYWDDVRIEPIAEITKEIATSFYLLDANGTEEFFPTELYLGEPAEVVVGIENKEHEPVNYTLQIKQAGETLKTEMIKLGEESKWAQKLSFTPNQIGLLLKLEFLLFKDLVGEEPYKAFLFWVSSYLDYDNLGVLKEYVVSSLPVIINGDMESETPEGWIMENTTNFTVKLTDSDCVSPMHSYELSYPPETPFDPGCYAGIYQNFTTETCPVTIAVSFNVKDSYTADDNGYFIKQVLLNEDVIWEDDVAGNERWQHVNVPVTLRSAANKLTLRVYGARGSDNLPITVWWDDVAIVPVTAVGEEIATSFYIIDTKGTGEEYPMELYLGVPAAVRVGIENNEHKEVNYILQMKLDGKLLKSKSKWLKHGSKWEQNISFTPDGVGERQKLEFILFKDYVKEKPYRYYHLWVSTAINYDNLEPLLRYGIEPLPTIRDEGMSQIYAWTREPEYVASFSEVGNVRNEYTSPPCSYCIRQYRESEKGDYMGLSQDIYASESGVAVLAFNVRDSFDDASEDAKKIIKQVLLNDKVIWADDVSGEDEGYVGWVEEEYVGPIGVWIKHIKSHEGFLGWQVAGHNWWEDDWLKESVPDVESGWMHVDIPVYLCEGNNELKLQVYAKDSAEYLDVEVYWDDVEIRPITELVKVDERVRMRRYGR
jgi:uncharacterized membrane protein